MSHSTVLVIGEDPEAMLAPYDEGLEVEPYRKYEDIQSPKDHWLMKVAREEGGLSDDCGWPAFIAFVNQRYNDEDPYFHDEAIDRMYRMSTYNPMSRWDWYLLGGRWTGYFDLRAGATGVLGEPGVMTDRATGGQVDQARKRDIDFDAMRARHSAEAVDIIRKVLAVLKDQPPLMPWQRYRDEWPGNIDGARKAYHAQPGLKALDDARLDTFEDPVEFYCLGSAEPETAYVAKHTRACVTPFAVLNEQGWAERGRMGWFGMVADETDPIEWTDRAWSLIDAAPEDALFSLYDVHI